MDEVLGGGVQAGVGHGLGEGRVVIMEEKDLVMNWYLVSHDGGNIDDCSSRPGHHGGQEGVTQLGRWQGGEDVGWKIHERFQVIQG